MGVGFGVGAGTGVQDPRASPFSPAGQQVPITVAWPAGQQAPSAIGMEPLAQHWPPEVFDPGGSIVHGRHLPFAGPPATCPPGQQIAVRSQMARQAARAVAARPITARAALSLRAERLRAALLLARGVDVFLRVVAAAQHRRRRRALSAAGRRRRWASGSAAWWGSTTGSGVGVDEGVGAESASASGRVSRSALASGVERWGRRGGGVEEGVGVGVDFLHAPVFGIGGRTRRAALTGDAEHGRRPGNIG